jgi:hypothetical protein
MIYFLADIVQWVSSIIGFSTIVFLVYMKFVQSKTLFSKRVKVLGHTIEISTERGKELVIKIKS